MNLQTIFLNKASKVASLIMLLLLTTAVSISANEQYQLVVLPDMGYGSSANNLTPDIGSARSDIVGEMTLPSGANVPVHWHYEEATDSMVLTELPISQGYQGTAIAMINDQNGKQFVIGNLIDGMGTVHAVYWHEGESVVDGTARWSASHFLPDAGYGSRANGLNPDIGSTRGDVIGEMILPGGLNVPVQWTIDLLSGVVTQEQLPIPLNAGGAANGLTPDLGSSRSDVVGEMTRPDGMTIPVHWRYDAATDSMIMAELPIPQGYQGVGREIVQQPNGKRVAAGTLIDLNGVSYGVIWQADEPAADGSFVWSASTPLPHVGHGSRVNGLNPDVGSSRGDVVGKMTLPSGLVVPVIWMIELDSGEVNQISFAQLPLPMNASGTANGLLPSLGSSRGDVIGTMNQNGVSQAVLWLVNDAN